MYQTLDVFRTAGAMAHHAGSRQAVVARNIANADTPGFRAQQIAPFQEAYRAQSATTARQSRPGHLTAEPPAHLTTIQPGPGEASPNGNTVSIEDEMLASISASRDHNRALAIYRHAMTILRTTLGRG